MTNAEAHVLRQLDKLGGVWPTQGPQDKVGVEAYVEALVDLDPMDLEAATLSCISSCRFYPKPAEIREAAADLRTRALGLPDAYEAWGLVQTAVRRGAGHPIAGANGRGPGAALPAPVQKAVEYLGGWRTLAMSENQVADRARFIEAYREVHKREVMGMTMLPAVRDHVKALADSLSVNGRKRLEAPDAQD